MKIFNTEEIRAIDRRTMEIEGITSLELIGRVAHGVASEIVARWSPNRPVIVYAGPGNNGADALAVALILADHGFRPSVYLLNIGGNRLSRDCRDCRDKLRADAPGIDFTEVTGRFSLPEMNSNTLIIDGLFGSGLKGQLTGGFMMLVRAINDSGATVVSIDVPSGMSGDLCADNVNRNIIHANLTLAVQFPRPAFFMKENEELIGEWKTLDIGLNAEAIRSTPTGFHFVEANEVKSLLRPRKQFSSKADYGSALLIAGSYGMMGAAVLAARGALRAGVGKLTVHSPQCGYEILQSSVPEAMFEADTDKNKLVIGNMKPTHDYSAIGIGCGIGTHEITENALEQLLQLRLRTKPVVLDADALNCIARRPTLINDIPVLSVLTPHAEEFDRIFGNHTTDEARLLKAIEVAFIHKIIILLKGRYTALVYCDHRVYFNPTGCPAMATPGSGDVLTGVITSLMAQGYKPEVSALLGAYIHGLAGEIAQEAQGDYGVTAGDIAANIGVAIKNLLR
ncbi:MAG: NAD(P)H-hydrate dehydratase [Paramuribaculum sp.]|nr:NAD(P)H-hydrate dehydratase [Paramuribaculum sp.]